MKICIRPHDVGKGSASFLGEKIHQLGFDGVQLAVAKAIEGQNGSPATMTPEVIADIRNGFEQNGVSVALLGAYFNPVHADAKKVSDGIAKYADHLQKSKLFGTLLTASETGSYNNDSWTYNPLNQTDEAFKRVADVFGPLAETAKKAGTYAVIEGAWHHCIYSPARMKQLLDEIDNGHVRITVDIRNYLYEGNYEQRTKIFEDCLSLFEGKIAAFHIKDIVLENGKIEETEIGKGIMGWDKFLPVIKSSCPNVPLVFEGVKNVEQSLAYVKQILAR